MKPSETLPPASTYVGHVKNGVIVVDTAVALPEGQAVRIEPLPRNGESPVRDALTEQLDVMKTLFAQWDEEDSQIPGETAEQFHAALEQNRGLRFHAPKVD